MPGASSSSNSLMELSLLESLLPLALVVLRVLLLLEDVVGLECLLFVGVVAAVSVDPFAPLLLLLLLVGLEVVVVFDDDDDEVVACELAPLAAVELFAEFDDE